MQLVIQRSRMNGLWYSFRINARLDVTEEETLLLGKYKLRSVALTEGNTWRDLKRSFWLTAPASALLTFSFVGKAFLIFACVFFIAFALVYLSIREVVIVGDLLHGRDFKARSMVNLLIKEREIKEIAGVFETVVGEARTWHVPEVIDLKPETSLSELEGENALV